MKIYNFKDHNSGTTFNGVDFALIINNKRKNITGALIELIFTGKTYSTSNAEITITDAVNGKFRFNKQIITLPVGRNKYKMRFTFSDGTVKIYMEGQWRIQ